MISFAVDANGYGAKDTTIAISWSISKRSLVPPIWRGVNGLSIFPVPKSSTMNIHEIPWANGFRIVLGFVLFHNTFINKYIYIHIHIIYIYINIIFHQINHPYSLYPWTLIGFELLTVWITSLKRPQPGGCPGLGTREALVPKSDRFARLCWKNHESMAWF